MDILCIIKKYRPADASPDERRTMKMKTGSFISIAFSITSALLLILTMTAAAQGSTVNDASRSMTMDKVYSGLVSDLSRVPSNRNRFRLYCQILHPGQPKVSTLCIQRLWGMLKNPHAGFPREWRPAGHHKPSVYLGRRQSSARRRGAFGCSD